MSSGWTLNFGPRARKALRRIDRAAAARIVHWLEQLIVERGEPRSAGKALSGPFGEFWRYRIGDHRAIVLIEDGSATVLVVEIGHRGEVYR